MKILFAADENQYSAEALPQVARLGENTWADIILLGISTKPVGTPATSGRPAAKNDSKIIHIDLIRMQFLVT